ncbi:hypothetical protein BDZ45DRAFT_115071 [Acephala macrosclerotiorum]|nr:hypothetical protein BDZ45DRAFT_115071 [Acephala macrosclerotiorum]
MACDLLSLILKSVGGAIASIADDHKTTDLEVNIMIAGLISQVVSLTAFAILCADFAIQPRKRLTERAEVFCCAADLILEGILRMTYNCHFTIYRRSCFRVTELRRGFDSSLANNQVVFMILEGGMLFAATTCQTIFHPHYAFQGSWHDENFGMGKEKSKRTLEGLARFPVYLVPRYYERG